MTYFVRNFSATIHNRRLFTPKRKKDGKRTSGYVQIVQGPLLPDEVEIDEEDIEMMYIYFFRKGKLTEIKYHMCVKGDKIYSIKSDYDKHIDGWGEYEYDYMRLRESQSENSRKLCTAGWCESSMFDVYRPGGMIMSFNDDPKHAISIYNDYLKENASKYMRRCVDT